MWYLLILVFGAELSLASEESVTLKKERIDMKKKVWSSFVSCPQPIAKFKRAYTPMYQENGTCYYLAMHRNITVKTESEIRENAYLTCLWYGVNDGHFAEVNGYKDTLQNIKEYFLKNVTKDVYVSQRKHGRTVETIHCDRDTTNCQNGTGALCQVEAQMDTVTYHCAEDASGSSGPCFTMAPDIMNVYAANYYCKRRSLVLVPADKWLYVPTVLQDTGRDSAWLIKNDTDNDWFFKNNDECSVTVLNRRYHESEGEYWTSDYSACHKEHSVICYTAEARP